MTKTKRKRFPKPRARKIPLDLVKNFLQEKGYVVIKLWQPWRHVIGIVKKADKQLFFKMATTVKIGRMTKNEFFWNELISKKLNLDAPFLVPKNIEKGLFQERLFFFISDYFGDRTLADKYPPRTKGLNKWIFKIAKTAYVIGNINHKLNNRQKEKPIGEHLLESATEWSSQLQSDTQPLLEVIRKSRQQVKRAFSHGDFVPWHMYDLKNGKLGLVDAEHGGWKAKYYDVAYFYLRVRQSLGEKELARKFLLKFIDLLPQEEKSSFWDGLKPVLSQRLVGNFWEVEIGHEMGKDIELQKCEEFKKDLVGDRII